jgi:DNA-directed RNA polymerase specialized sigma24 family protein
VEPAREYLRALGCGADEAQDMIQDFLHRLLVRGADASVAERLDGSFRTYLKRSLRNFVIDHRRAATAGFRDGMMG